MPLKYILATSITFSFLLYSIYFCKKIGLLKKVLFCLFISLPIWDVAQNKDSVPPQKDSIQHMIAAKATSQYAAAIQSLLNQNIFLNSTGTPVTMVAKPKEINTNETFFYLLAGLILFVGLIRFFFSQYFNNLFRVFFNTSLRQSQLADQLVQAKLPALFFNIFFIISAGIYSYFIVQQYHLVTHQHKWMLLGCSILIIGIIYLIKFSSLKFTGWVTGYTEVTNTYIFVIFLISKILGVLLIPFTVLIAFSSPSIALVSAVVSLLIIIFLLLMRFFRSYGLLQNQLKVSRFHFFLYIAGVEILPILLIYRGLMLLLSKNL